MVKYCKILWLLPETRAGGRFCSGSSPNLNPTQPQPNPNPTQPDPTQLSCLACCWPCVRTPNVLISRVNLACIAILGRAQVVERDVEIRA